MKGRGVFSKLSESQKQVPVLEQKKATKMQRQNPRWLVWYREPQPGFQAFLLSVPAPPALTWPSKTLPWKKKTGIESSFYAKGNRMFGRKLF